MKALVSAEELVQRLDDPRVSVLEIAREPDDARFRSARVPGSHFAYWKDLLWHDTDRRFADASTLAARLGALGISEEHDLVLSGDPIQFATYAYWVLQMAGRDASVLDGGRARWIVGGYPIETGEPAAPVPVAHASGIEDASAAVGRDVVLAALGTEVLILDFRTPEEYRGERVAPLEAPFDHGAERKGRIPGARHLWFEQLLAADGTFRPPDELRAVFAEAGVRDDSAVIAYCRLSHRATLGWFALRNLLGHRDARVYDGSWTEWGSIVGVPIER